MTAPAPKRPDESAPDYSLRLLETRAGKQLRLVKDLSDENLRLEAELKSRDAELTLPRTTQPELFVERHIGESLEGAAMLDPLIEGSLLDLGSGNGYPGLPICIVHPGLRPVLAEARTKKAIFLTALLAELMPGGEVLSGRVDRPADLGDRPPVKVIVTRAASGWERILPRLARSLTEDGHLLVWAGRDTRRVARHVAWRHFRLEARHPLLGRDASWIWHFRRA